MMLRLLGVAERAKLGGAAVTVRLIVVVCVKFPEVPVMVTMAVPVEAALLAGKERVLVGGGGVGEEEGVTAVGRRVAVKFTLPLKPLRGLMAMVLEPAAPSRMVKLVGDAERVKLG